MLKYDPTWPTVAPDGTNKAALEVTDTVDPEVDVEALSDVVVMLVGMNGPPVKAKLANVQFVAPARVRVAGG